MDVLQYFLVLGVLLVGGGLVAFASVKRAQDMRQFGRQHGMRYHTVHNFDALHCLKKTTFISNRSDGEIVNAIFSEFDRNRIVICDYRYLVRTNRNRTHKTQRVTLLLPAQHNFPTFSMRPEGIVQKAAVWMGFQDIDFPECPEFSDAYLLQAANEPFIRKFFDRETLDIFAAHPGWWIESVRSGLLIYKPNRYDKATMQESVDLAHRILPVFEEQGARLLRHELSDVQGLSCMQWLPESLPPISSSFRST